MTDWGPFSLAGRHAIVTGAAMGIGFGIARRYVEAGADVLLVDLDEPALRAVAERLAGAQGKSVSLLRSPVRSSRVVAWLRVRCGVPERAGRPPCSR